VTLPHLLLLCTLSNVFLHSSSCKLQVPQGESLGERYLSSTANCAPNVHFSSRRKKHGAMFLRVMFTRRLPCRRKEPNVFFRWLKQEEHFQQKEKSWCAHSAHSCIFLRVSI
ncbi:unnamed protein product, partial [Heterosigma akashiwo]